jgi:2-methylcitrate dehydratase PrpD
MNESLNNASEITDSLINFILNTNFKDIPKEAINSANRSLVNIMGCMIGGSSHPILKNIQDSLSEFSGLPNSTVAGFNPKTDSLNATLLNTIACSAYAFDDTHSEAIVHPSGPVASSLFSLTEQKIFSGEEFLAAFTVGVEVICRISLAISVHPAEGSLSWMQSSVIGGIGSAAACSKLLGLNFKQTKSAIALASSQASGFRSMFGTMAIPLLPAHGAQTGIRAAILAKNGLDCSTVCLESIHGFFDVFSSKANFNSIIEGLGSNYEINKNTFKPYPCGIVIHPIIDALLNIKKNPKFNLEKISKIKVFSNTSAFKLTANRANDKFQARTSLYYWSAIALTQNSVGISSLDDKFFNDQALIDLQDKIYVIPKDEINSDAARVEILLNDGSTINSEIFHCIGSRSCPMNNNEIGDKFLNLSYPILGIAISKRILNYCWNIQDLSDVSKIIKLCSGMKL